MKIIKLVFLLFTTICFSQTKEIKETLTRIINGNKVGFVKNGFVIVPFEYDLEPKGKRHIGRYMIHDSVYIDYGKYEIKCSIIDPNRNISNTTNYNIEEDYSLVDNSNEHNKYRIDCNYNFFNNDYNYEGYYAVYKNGKYGYINTEGKLIIPLEYEKAVDFKYLRNSSLPDWVDDKKEEEKILGYYIGIAKNNGKYGIINPKNETILNFVFDDILYFNSDKEYSGNRIENEYQAYYIKQYTYTFYCIYKNKTYFIKFKNGVFELPDELKK